MSEKNFDEQLERLKETWTDLASHDGDLVSLMQDSLEQMSSPEEIRMEDQLEQLREVWSGLALGEGDIVPLMQESVKNWTPSEMEKEIGTVLTVGDGIATVSGLPHVTYGEILIFAGGVLILIPLAMLGAAFGLLKGCTK